MSKERTLQIHFVDLTLTTQAKVLAFLDLQSPEQMNADVFPILLIDECAEDEQAGMTFDQALETALKEVKDQYAQNYLQGLDSIPIFDDIAHYPAYPASGCAEWVVCQLQYALSNMQHYRGKTARQVKQAFEARITALSVCNLSI